MTEIPEPYLETTCKKESRCKFIGHFENKNICLKDSPFAPAIIQLELAYSKEAKDEDSNYPKGDNCPGMSKVLSN